MTPKTLTYGRTFNLGNFNSERIELTVDLDAVDEIAAAGDAIRNQVHELHERNKQARLDRDVALRSLERPDDRSRADWT